MILEALVSQLEQRFQHEKRARICLWFDERSEFARLLPLLDAHVASRTKPPFVLLAYDKAQRHGQIWLKHQVHQRFEAASPAERASLRVVVYVPLPEERLDATNRDDEVCLDLLEEFRAIGVFFRIGGKRPTLFSFLKQAGVALPDGPSDQRRLYEGGRDSLLAKYSAKFVDRPPVFWETTLTPDVAQSRLIGDVDQTILELAADPDTAWAALHEKGLGQELAVMVKERYGFEAPGRAPTEWVREFVTTVALTETFFGYGEPADFPLKNKLPPLPVRAHHVALVHRWLRDAEYRPAWDRRVEEVETDVDLSAWADGHPAGRSVAFPHLVWQRWRRTWQEFEAASAKESSTESFFSKTRAVLAEQAEFLKARDQEIGHWQLLRDLDALVTACARARKDVNASDEPHAHVALFVKHAREIDGAHLEIRYAAEEAGLPAVAKVADRAYASYTNALNEAFFKQIAAAKSLDGLGLPGVTQQLEKSIWKGHGRRAVIIVDALRYDCAVAIGEHLRGQSVEITPVLAMLPTITPVGMTAMLPLSGSTVEVELKQNSLHPKVGGKDFAARAARLTFLDEFGADCRDISEVESASVLPDAGDLLVVYGHEEVDSIGHGQAETLIRHVHLEIERLARLVRKFHRWGYGHVHIVTDHGFILLDEQKLPSEVECDKSWCHVLKERYAIVPASADIPLVTLPLSWAPEYRVAVPPGLAFFKAEKSFSHGGAALQELVIPHLVSRGQAPQGKRVALEVVLPTFELQRPAVKVTVRVAASAAQKDAQLPIFSESGRTLSLEVLRRAADGSATSVLASKAKELRIEPKDKEQSVTLFFHTAASFQKGELLELDIRDVETTEQFPPGGIKLTVGRDM
ncbi:PglZ domain-containing protein [Myxococcus sp. MxC21-1]|uniref:PglZ domain-containing protein n=1 Tax=Myxococcus sp. MxC21-1 TaxID=3041439 RepID=UPI002930830E|nr:PglZ domain-containing protein [Myxococcus sp. MxC21-1]WNZ59538.1 PglZ domain-containing protein [Myxococcus sp. MxC21-1]